MLNQTSSLFYVWESLFRRIQNTILAIFSPFQVTKEPYSIRSLLNSIGQAQFPGTWLSDVGLYSRTRPGIVREPVGLWIMQP